MKIILLMLSLDVCKQFLNAGERTYSNEEVKQIREYLYLLASLQVEADKLNETEQIKEEER